MSGSPYDDVDDDGDYDVMASEPIGDDDDDGHEWDANEMGRSAGEAESEPLDDDDDDLDGDDEGEALDDDEDDEELQADDDLDEDEEGPDDEDDKEDEEEDQYEPLEPQANWPVEFQEAFADLPPIAQHFVMNTARSMQADYTRKTQAIAQERQQIHADRQRYNEFDRVLAPHIQKWALSGMNPSQAVTQLVALSDFATNDPQGFIQYFANLRGVDLQALNQEQEYVDPQVAALRQQQAQVQAQLNQMSQQYAQSQQQQAYQQYAAQHQQVSAGIDQAARQTDQNGNPLYPYLDLVAGDMADIIEAGRQNGQVPSFAEAYRKAVWMNETTRSKVLARSRQNENARARERTERARRAAASLTGASGSNGAFTGGDMSIRDLLTAASAGEI